MKKICKLNMIIGGQLDAIESQSIECAPDTLDSCGISPIIGKPIGLPKPIGLDDNSPEDSDPIEI
jgi:hypothetical protein